MNFFTIIIWALLGLAALGLLRLLLLRRLMQGMRRRSEEWKDAAYEPYPNDKPPFDWRGLYRRYAEELESIGYSTLLWFYNAKDAQRGKPNFYGVFRSPDGSAAAAVSFMTVERFVPFLGIPLPFPYWSGRSIHQLSIQSLLSNGTRLFTVSDFAEGYSRLPKSFEVCIVEPGASPDQLVKEHERALSASRIKGLEAVPVESGEAYLEDQREQHKLLAEHHEQMVEEMLQELMPDPTDEDDQ